MPFVRRRRFRPRRPRRPRRRNVGRRYGFRMTRSIGSSKVHNFKRTLSKSLITNGASNTFGSYDFRLADFPDYSEFTSLYDSYRVNKIVINWYPIFSQSMTTDVSGVNVPIPLPRMIVVVDHNDATAPTTEDEMLQYQRKEVWNVNRRHTTVFIPAMRQVMYKSDTPGSEFGYAVKYKQWIATADAGVPLYGVKWMMGSTTANLYAVRPQVTIYFSCKSVI